MKIKIIAENDMEKRRFREKFGSEKIEHAGIKEYFIFGNKNEDNDTVDFHEWTGSHRYLLSGLNYFYEIINDQRKAKAEAESRPSGAVVNSKPFPRPPMRMLDKQEPVNVTGEEVERVAQAVEADIKNAKMVKRGEVNEQDVAPIDVEALKQNIQEQPEQQEQPESKIINFKPNKSGEAQFVEEKEEQQDEKGAFDEQEIPQPPEGIQEQGDEK